MAPLTNPLYRLLTPLLHHKPSPSILSKNAHPSRTFSTTPNTPFRSTMPTPFSVTPPTQAGPPTKKGIKYNQQDPRITLIRYHLMHPLTPRPLRLSRLRFLRHWTIHRAWLLFQRKEREREERTLERQFQSMHRACEELRNHDDGGKLYRIAMLKKGVYTATGIPIEYARAQVERPGKEAWNHGWTR